MHSNRNSDTQVATDFDKLCKVYPKVLLVGNYITFLTITPRARMGYESIDHEA